MTVILVRHGRSTANTSGVLAGRTPGVGLDDLGREQADALVGRLAEHHGAIRAVVRSPLDRCAQTVEPLLGALRAAPGRADGVLEEVVDELAEVDYGSGGGPTIKEPPPQPPGEGVPRPPSAAVFPGGEGLAQMSARSVAAIRSLDRRFAGDDGNGLWVACSHGDVIKSVIADAMGMHLDSFQRIVVDTASITVIRYGSTRPYIHTVNNTAAVPVPVPRPPRADGGDDAVVGGETGAHLRPGVKRPAPPPHQHDSLHDQRVRG